MIPLVVSISMGALFGDIVESFFKRRIGKERGESWYPFDQLDFVLGALILALLMSTILQLLGCTPYNWFLKNFTPYHLLVIFVATPIFHVIGNLIHRKRF
jgi:CDP-2,3-bis-(O-geranylgeranyl)-sn-glycerol synthase